MTVFLTIVFAILFFAGGAAFAVLAELGAG